MKPIYKQPISVGPFTVVGVVVHAAEQHGVPVVWFESDGLPRNYRLFMTGEAVPEDWEHVSTFLAEGGSFVGHLYREI